MEEVLCSVIIPAYNAEKCIDNCLKSLDLNGCYAYNLEVLVIDDGSKDETAKVVSAWSEKYTNVKLIQKENGGVSSARNLGLEKACGKYIFFADSDDQVNRAVLDEMITEAEQKGVDIVIADFEKYNILDNKRDRENSQIISQIKHDRNYIEKNILVRYFNFEHSGLAGMGNKLYLLEKIRLFGLIFDNKRSYGEDLKFNISYFLKATSVASINKSVYIYKLDGTQNYYKYRTGLAYSLIDNIQMFKNLNDNYIHYKKDSKNFLLFMANMADRSLKYLALKACSDKEKKEFLKTKEQKELWGYLLGLNKERLFEAGYSRRNKLTFFLLKLGRWKLALKLLGRTEE